MDSSWINTFAITGGFLVLLKLFLAALAWVYKDKKLYRSQLKELAIHLGSRTLFSIAHDFLKLLDKRIWVRLDRPISAIILFVTLTLVLNLLAFFIGTGTFEPRTSPTVLGESFIILQAVIGHVIGTVDQSALFVATYATVGFGLLFDSISIIFTIWLIGHAANAASWWNLLLHITLDIIVVILSVIGVALMATIATGSFILSVDFFWKICGDVYYLITNPTAGDGQGVYLIITGVTAAVPSVLYLGLLGLVLGVRLLPEQVRVFLVFIIRRVASDESTPVLDQISGFFNWLAAGIVAIVVIAKSF